MSAAMQSTTHGASVPNETQIQQTLVKVMYLGLALTLGLSVLLLVVGYFLRLGNVGDVVPTRESRVLFYALLAVAISEVPVAVLLKKHFLKPMSGSDPQSTPIPTTGFIQSRYLVLFNLAAACSFYGFVWYLLGGTLPEFALFAVIGLIIFRLVRPSADFFFSLFGVRPAIE